MTEIPRPYFKITCLELCTALMYLAIDMHGGGSSGMWGYTVSRLAFLALLGAMCLLSGIPAYLLSQDLYERMSGYVVKQLRQRRVTSYLTLSLATLAGLAGMLLLAAPLLHIRLISSRFDILWLCLVLICLQTLVVLGTIHSITPAVRFIELVKKVAGRFTELNRLGFDIERPVLPQWLGVKIVQAVLLILAYLVYRYVVFHAGESGIQFRYGFTGIILVSFILLNAAYSLRGWSGFFFGLTVTLVLFGLPLAGLWSGAFNESSVFRGLIPWSDANSYFIDANRLLDGGLFQDKSARRPLFAGFLAVLLGITQYNLQSALLLLAAVNALTCYLAGREMQRTHGRLASTTLVILLFIFYRRYAGTTLTENLGFALGTLGFALLWRGAWHRHRHSVLAGILITTLALNARAGAYFVLPLLALWAARLIRKNELVSRSMLFYGIGAVMISFALNMLVYRTVSIEQSSPESNFSNVLYGLTNGGEPWDQVYRDHPHIEPLDEPLHSQLIYGLAWDTFKSSPFKTVQGICKGWQYFFDFDKGMFNFIRSAYFDENNLILRRAAYIFSILAVIRCMVRKREANTTLVMAAMAGIILSVPFVPLWDAAYMRLYAASIPFIAALPILGLTWLGGIISRQNILIFGGHDNSHIMNRGTTLEVSILLAAMTILGPIAIKLACQAPELPSLSCPDGQKAVIARVTPGSYLNIVDDEQSITTWVPDIMHSNYVSGSNYDFPDAAWLEKIKTIESQTSLINQYDMLTGYNVLLFIDSNQLPGGNHLMGFCGTHEAGSSIFVADSAHIIEE